MSTVRAVPSPRPGTRRRMWLLAGVAAGLVAAYLLGWIAYARSQLPSETRYVPLPHGAPATIGDATLRVLSLQPADELASHGGGDAQLPAPVAVWVVAELEISPKRPEPNRVCRLGLLGPGGRIWEAEYPGVQRALPSSCGPAAALGKPGRFETVFLVPKRYASELVGVVLNDGTGSGRKPALTPP